MLLGLILLVVGGGQGSSHRIGGVNYFLVSCQGQPPLLPLMCMSLLRSFWRSKSLVLGSSAGFPTCSRLAQCGSESSRERSFQSPQWGWFLCCPAGVMSHQSSMWFDNNDSDLDFVNCTEEEGHQWWLPGASVQLPELCYLSSCRYRNWAYCWHWHVTHCLLNFEL